MVDGKNNIRAHLSVLGQGECGNRLKLLFFHQVLHLRRSDEADIRGLLADKLRRVSEEPTAAAELEIGVEHRLAGSGERLHDAVPAVHLVDNIPVNLFRDILGRNLFCSLRSLCK